MAHLYVPLMQTKPVDCAGESLKYTTDYSLIVYGPRKRFVSDNRAGLTDIMNDKEIPKFHVSPLDITKFFAGLMDIKIIFKKKNCVANLGHSAEGASKF